MVLAGRWQAKTGPSLMTVLGGLLLGLGSIVSAQLGDLEFVPVECHQSAR